MRTDTPQYGDSWDTYWSATEEQQETSLWDAPAELASAVDLPRFAAHLDRDKVLIDLGCGNGTQTRYLAQHFGHVIGADVSPAAIKAATAADPDTSYMVLDLFDTPAVEALHERLGDANIYMRTVLHQILPEHRPAFARSLRTLLGTTGVLAFVELAPTAEQYLHDLVERHGPPPGLTRVLSTGVRPGSVDGPEALALLGSDAFTVLAEGDSLVHTTFTLPNGQRAQVPAYFMALRHTTGQPSAPRAGD
ncbi:class I SAM-dependent methyltransferase [Streptomyces sp. NBC_01304]|uniref:class I SAM-dependent methyltransferase n=1 Tax=Streptomyces sp. NBC_01304 TaxID=2903818 RepID=UPI002E0EF677|nr:methyltransferase domain-containing protein [Streptomyces sp. NBC_01304]